MIYKNTPNKTPQDKTTNIQTPRSAAALMGYAGLLCSVLPLATIASTSQETPAYESADQQAQEVIVTANRMSQPLNETLAASTVFTLEDIEASQALSLFDLLSGSPGIQMTRTGGQGTQTSLFMRGTNSDHTLILIDGVKANTASEGFARLENIPVAQIERIEVVRGPQSSLYGADAIGGVIQIFTKQAVNRSVEPGMNGSVSVAAGTESTFNTNGSISTRINNTSLSLNVAHHETDGIRPIHTPTPSARRSAYDSDAADVSIAHEFTGGATLRGGYYWTESELVYDGGINNSDAQTANIGLSLPVTEQWQSDVQLARFEDESINRSTFGSQSRTERDSFNWQNHIELGEHALVLGADFESEELLYLSSGATQSDTSRDNSAAFAVIHSEFPRDGNSLHTTFSLRYDDNEQFGGETTGKAAIGTDLGATMQLWASYSTAFKAPTLVDLYVDFPAFFFYGNPDLQPETSRNVELGLRGSNPSVGWSVNAFRNEIKNLIATDASFTTLANVESALINGLELSIQGEWSGWQANAALTLLDHENRDTGQELLRRPNQTLSAGVSRTFQKLEVGLDWHLRGKQKDVDPVTFGTSSVDSSAVFDLVMEYQLINDLRLQLKIGNLFDRDYQVVDGYNTYGRTALVTTRYQF